MCDTQVCARTYAQPCLNQRDSIFFPMIWQMVSLAHYSFSLYIPVGEGRLACARRISSSRASAAWMELVGQEMRASRARILSSSKGCVKWEQMPCFLTLWAESMLKAGVDTDVGTAHTAVWRPTLRFWKGKERTGSEFKGIEGKGCAVLS
jgi:hypothetical protein